jgi:hypothetical protein
VDATRRIFNEKEFGGRRSVPALLLLPSAWVRQDASPTEEAKRGRFAYTSNPIRVNQTVLQDI